MEMVLNDARLFAEHEWRNDSCSIEGITAALSQMHTETKPTNHISNNNNNNQSRNNSGCFVCGRTGHIAKNCHQRNNQQNNKGKDMSLETAITSSTTG
ncbi:hypothetical protein RhiirC2_793346 [Rhizophagus irregularis]|uniref:CCHC-type domain-containing protein n=1 Tax=Rhizophagus irregularis TaxID=588596 RepID=A0A2N1MFI8_9GLOM|nr:hypothetical protein RhiirC2_793346 [Rhizophagus irregularis]